MFHLRILFMKLPAKVFGVEGRYATALYSAAVKKNILDKTEKEMATFAVSKATYTRLPWTK